MYLKLLLLISLLLCKELSADELIIGSGKGYKKPVSKLIKAFKKNVDIKVLSTYSNITQIISQAKNSKEIAIIIGEKGFLNKSKLDFNNEVLLGNGQMVLIYKKGLKLDNNNDILKDDIKKIAIANPKKAIYGKAAKDFFQSNHILKKVSNKLLVVSTSPQVLSYVISGDVDVGFTNAAAIKGLENKIGGYIFIDKKMYNPLVIVAREINGINKNANLFMDYIKSKEAQIILKEYSLID